MATARTRHVQTRYLSPMASLPDETAQRLGNVEGAVNRMEITVARIEAQMPTRHDIEAAVGNRVEISTYTVSTQAILDRISRLEGSPQRMLGWLAMGVGCASALATAFGVVTAIAAIIVTILLHG